MNYLAEHIVSYSYIKKARQCLDNVCFESIVLRFIETALTLPKSPKINDYAKILEHFRVQYYNEFLFKVSVNTQECKMFIETIGEFFKTQRHKKSDYASLFQTLGAFYTTSVGGTSNNIPLIFHDVSDLETCKPLFMVWNSDQVNHVRQEMNIHTNKCFMCQSKYAQETLFGAQMCPAACLPICKSCVADQEKVSDYLQRCSHLMLPEVSAALKSHLKESKQVWEELSVGQCTVLERAKLCVQQNGKKIVRENVYLKKLNSSLKSELDEKTQQNKFLVSANEEYLISLRDEQRAHDKCVRDIERHITHLKNLDMSHKELTHQFNGLARSNMSLRAQLADSVKAQWGYYNKLKQFGVV